MKKLFLIIACLLAMADLHAQIDTEFWFTTPPCTRGIYSSSLSNWILTTDAFLSEWTSINYTFYYINSTTHSLDSSSGEFANHSPNRTNYNFNVMPNFPGINLTQRDQPVGIHVTSTSPISCQFRFGDSDFSKGSIALGTQFLIPVPHILPAHSIQSNIELVATHDSTIVHFTPTADLSDGTLAGQTVAIQLRRGETFWAQARSHDCDSQLGGSSITSNYPIAVNVTSTHLVNPTFPQNLTPVVIRDQILPEENLGRSYAIVTNGDNTDANADYASIFATKDNTTVSINGVRFSPTLNRGEHMVVLLADTINYISADYPVAIFQTSCRNCDYGGTFVQPLGCGGTQMATLPKPKTLEMYIVVPTAYADRFFFWNDLDFPVQFDHPFRPVPGNSAYSWTIFHNGGSGFPVINNDSSPFQLSIISKSSRRTFVYYPSALASPTVPHYRLSNTNYCCYDSIRFDHADHNMGKFQIHGPHNIHLSSPDSLILVPTDTSFTGWYHISGTTTPNCADTTETFYDSIYITINNTYIETRYDTIVENQTPWTYHGSIFTQSSDTIVRVPAEEFSCDSVFVYHLFVHPNIYDTLHYYICESELPFIFPNDTLTDSGTLRFSYGGSHGVDSNVIVQLHVVPTSHAYIYDTIVESQLPWYALDTVFTDSVSEYLYQTYSEAGCDSLIHYSLYIFWEGDHCDSSLTYPNVVTPNGDGQNDRFVIGGLLENQCYKYNELSIFSREGATVFHKRNITSDSDWWDPAAHHAPDGTYFFIFKAHGIKIHTMHKGIIEVLSE